MKNIIIVLILSAFMLFSCSTTRTISTMEGTYEGFEVYTAKIPDKAFYEIKLIQVRSGSFTGPQLLMDRLVQQAKKEGADGLVNVQYQMLEKSRIISGTAVKFEKE